MSTVGGGGGRRVTNCATDGALDGGGTNGLNTSTANIMFPTQCIGKVLSLPQKLLTLILF